MESYLVKLYALMLSLLASTSEFIIQEWSHSYQDYNELEK